MADGVEIQVEGLPELNARLAEISDKAMDRAVRKGLRAGANIIQAAIAERAPVKDVTGGLLPPGALKSDIVIRMGKTDDGSLQALIGPDKDTARIARWVEYGHRQVRGGRSRLLANGKTRGNGKETGQVPAYPFIRPAWEATSQEVVNTVCSTIASEIEKAAKREGSL